jgi:dihydrofolate synthase/folylpolyglutamate synthase
MLNTKDVAGFMRPFAGLARHLWAVSIPGQKATLPAAETARRARRRDRGDRGRRMSARPSPPSPHHAHARILICGSLYFAGEVLAENG